MTTPESQPPEQQQRPRWIDLNLVFTLHFPAMAMGFGVGVTAVVLPSLTKDLGQTFLAAILVFIVHQLGATVGTLPTGLLVDRIGRRKVLLAGPLIVGASSLLIARAAIAGSFDDILVYRFIGGIGHQMWMLSRITVIADTGGARQRGKQVTSMIAVGQIGTLIGPIVGGVTADQLGTWVPFVIHASVVVAAAVPSFYLLKETMVARTAGGGGSATGARQRLTLQDLRKPPIPQVFAAQFLADLSRGGIFNGGVIISYAVFAYGMSSTEVGTLRSSMGIVSIPMSFASGYVMDRYGRKITLVPGLFLMGLSLICLGLTDALNLSTQAFVGAFIAVHFSTSIISGNMQTLNTDVAPAHARGAYFGVARLVGQTGSLASPGGFALLSQLFSFAAAFTYLGAGAFGASAVIGFLMSETLRKGPPAGRAAAQAKTPPERPEGPER